MRSEICPFFCLLLYSVLSTFLIKITDEDDFISVVKMKYEFNQLKGYRIFLDFFPVIFDLFFPIIYEKCEKYTGKKEEENYHSLLIYKKTKIIKIFFFSFFYFLNTLFFSL